LYQQPLTHDIVGLVSTSVVQVFALDIDFCPAEMAGEVGGKGQGRGPAGIFGHQVLVCQFIKGGNQNFRQERAAKTAVITAVFHGVIFLEINRW